MNQLIIHDAPTLLPRVLVPDGVIDNALRLAKIAVGSGLMKTTDGSDAIAMATMIILKGRDLGMSPTIALDCIALINGRTCVWGKAVPALVRSKGHRIREWETGTRMEDDWTFHCEITRGDTGDIITRSFSVTDAKQAQLWNQEPVLKRRGRDGPYEKPNDSPWFKYPQRMLPARARGYAAADGAPEALLGMYTVEEMQDVARAEALQEEDRGSLVAPPPPLAAPEPEAETSAGDEAETMAGGDAQTVLVENATDDAPAEAQDHPAEVRPNNVELAAVLCARAMGRAGTVKRLNDLMAAFGERFDGEIPRATTTQLDMIYEQNKDRIEKGKSNE